jgi:hypothetical protein
MSLLRKIEIGVLLTLVLAIISFAFYLGSLDNKINKIDTIESDMNKIINDKFEIKEYELKKDIYDIYTPLPVGSILAFSGKKGKIPEGWALCDGRSLNRDKYKRLYEVLGESWGGDREGSFNLPDIRGRFLRGVDYSAKRDKDSDTRDISAPGSNKGNEVGSSQIDSTRMPNNNFITNEKGAHTHDYKQFEKLKDTWKGGGSSSEEWTGKNIDKKTELNTDHSHKISGGDKETRPINVYVNWIIKLD